MGLQAGTTTLEINLAVPQKTGYDTTGGPRYTTPGHIPRDSPACIKDTCFTMFIAALFIIARSWKELRCPTTGKWIQKMWYIYHIFCIHSSVEGYLDSFQFLAIINKAAINRVEHVSLLNAGESSGYMPRSGIAGSSGSEVPSFRRNRQTDFQSGCTNLQPHQEWRSVPLSPHPLQHLLSPEFLILAILTGVR